LVGTRNVPIVADINVVATHDGVKLAERDKA
jgi:hypothetical protein